MNRYPALDRSIWRIMALVVLAVTAMVGIGVSLTNGAVNIPLAEVIKALGGRISSAPAQIIWNIRLPRALVGALVGMNLAVAGAILQGVMKNPLADPHIIGISSGAGLAGISVIALLPQLEYLLAPIAFLGALGAAGLVYILAWKGGIRPVRIILAGVAVSAFLGSGIAAILVFYSDRVHGALIWMVGGLMARSWPHLAMLLPYSIFGSILALGGARKLNVLNLGDEVARSLGLNVELTRLLMTAVAALLAASAVSTVGLLGFVGLIVPHVARLLIGSDYRFLLPAAALLGISTVSFSDTLARTLFAPVELPVGIIMAFLGAPFFLYLLRRET
jgi:iron complex transport system permease protein